MAPKPQIHPKSLEPDPAWVPIPILLQQCRGLNDQNRVFFGGVPLRGPIRATIRGFGYRGLKSVGSFKGFRKGSYKGYDKGLRVFGGLDN